MARRAKYRWRDLRVSDPATGEVFPVDYRKQPAKPSKAKRKPKRQHLEPRPTTADFLEPGELHPVWPEWRWDGEWFRRA